MELDRIHMAMDQEAAFASNTASKAEDEADTVAAEAEEAVTFALACSSGNSLKWSLYLTWPWQPSPRRTLTRLGAGMKWF